MNKIQTAITTLAAFAWLGALLTIAGGISGVILGDSALLAFLGFGALFTVASFTLERS
jgi:hypothetical protein